MGSSDVSEKNGLGRRSEREINLKDLYIVIKQRYWVAIIFIVLFTTLGSIYVNMPLPPLYEASTRVYLQASDGHAATIKVIVREPFVLDEVIKTLGINKSAESLRNQITVGSVESSTVLRISVVDSNPERAADIANAIVPSYNEVARGAVYFSSVFILTEAEANTQPINSRSNRAIYFGFIAGLLIGIGVIFLLDSLDDRIKTEREIEQLLGIVVLGYVAKIKRKDMLKNPKKQRNLSVRGETVGP